MAAEPQIFGVGAPRIWSIPAGSAFLEVLARELARALDLEKNPDALSDAIIYVPNRRSALGLGLALFRAAGERALLMPDIRTLGDIETEDEAPIAEVALNAMPAALTPGERLGALARMVRSYFATAFEKDLPPVSALAAARDLARLLDQAALSQSVNWDLLPDLAESADLAVHWQQSVRFLNILSQEWPAYVASIGRLDAPVRRLQAAEALVREWRAAPPSAPVIIAGSTGATPAGRLIMQATLELPKGLIVLPGLDEVGLSHDWSRIASAPSHPQYQLVRTLTQLQTVPQSVARWPGITDTQAATARRSLVREALAPADDTADWRERIIASATGFATEANFARAALSGMNFVEAANETAEAMLAAMLLREALETPGKTAALVTPDAGLSRVVSSLLLRWGIELEPSAGITLSRTQAGSFLGLCARWMLDPSDPVAMTALLKHNLARGFDEIDALEHRFLRGPRAWRCIASLMAYIPRLRLLESAMWPVAEVADAVAFVERIEALLTDASADVSTVDAIRGEDFIQSLVQLAGSLSETPWPFAGEDGRVAVRLLEHVRQLTEYLGDLPPASIVELIEAESQRCAVFDDTRNHPRLAIWGPLEARLQTADRMILAGLNENVWPDRPPADAFLPRRFRARLGLTDPEARVGLAAHDFAQLAAAPEVYLLSARRREDSPSLASRWVWRLKTLAEGALQSDTAAALKPDLPILHWLRQSEDDGVGTLPAHFTAKPAPGRVPPDWPRSLSATRVELLVRDPYALWAESALHLSPLAALNEGVAPNRRGTAVHKAVELYEALENKSAAAFVELLRDSLLLAGEPEETWFAREAVWRKTAQFFFDWHDARKLHADKDSVKREQLGSIIFTIAGAPFELRATADRLERLPDGTIAIVDFKTGGAPTDKQIRSGFSLQMPLEALILRDGGFTHFGNAQASRLEYVELRAKAQSKLINEKAGGTISELATIAEARLKALIASYRAQPSPIHSAPRAHLIKYPSDYTRLARRAEWAIEAVEGGDV